MSRTAGSTYQLIRSLGAGHYGTVWLAKNRQTSQQFAIKLAKDPANAQSVTSLRREALHLQRLEHASIPRFFGCEFTPTFAYVAMEHVAGIDLDRWLATNPSLPEKKKILLTIIEALNHAHNKLIVHLDLKNANIIVSENSLRGVVLDWGVAKTIIPENESDSPEHLGNLRNTPPECFNHYRKHDGKIFPYRPVQDIWSLGVIAYHVLSGRHPFEVPNDLIKTQERIIHETPELLPKRVGIWREVICKMLHKDPSARFQKCSDILQILDKKYQEPTTLDEILEPLVRDLAYELISSNEIVTGKMAQTNAFGYFLDDCHISDIDEIPSRKHKKPMTFKADIHYSGDQDEDRAWCGDSITVELHGMAVWENKRWSVETYEIDRCDINF